jgi:hypothetical protein
MNLLIGVLLTIFGQILVFLQIQGSIRYPLFQQNKILILIMGIPVTWIFIESVKYIVKWSDGEIWPSRIFSFSIGVIVFAIMSNLLFNETVSLKTGVCILLSIIILSIQILWK